ncbi:MAG: thioesterase family protein, partial [Pseudobdellovibrionaceae bacterium]|nr:thioesterase family protein [Pseudobdellovibrionaceae bacterium]
LETSEVEFICLPHDCDFHGHLTNSRYASFCDLARIGAMFDQGSLTKLLREGCTPVITAQEAVHYKEIAPLQKFQVKSTILGWDERFWIFRHDFYQKGQLKASVLAKGIFVRRKKLIPFAKVLEIAGHQLTSPTLPAYAVEWNRQSDVLYQNIKRSGD